MRAKFSFARDSQRPRIGDRNKAELWRLGRVAVEVTFQSVISMSGAGPGKRRFALHGDLSRYNCFWNWAMLSNEVSPTPMFLIFAGVLVAGTIALTISSSIWNKKAEGPTGSLRTWRAAFSCLLWPNEAFY